MFASQNHLESNDAVELRVLSSINNAHTTATNRFDDSITVDHFLGRKRRLLFVQWLRKHFAHDLGELRKPIDISAFGLLVAGLLRLLQLNRQQFAEQRRHERFRAVREVIFNCRFVISPQRVFELRHKRIQPPQFVVAQIGKTVGRHVFF